MAFCAVSNIHGLNQFAEQKMYFTIRDCLEIFYLTSVTSSTQILIFSTQSSSFFGLFLVIILQKRKL